MKRLIAATLATALIAAPLTAQTEEESDIDSGSRLMEEGARLLFRGLMSELEPAIDDLEGVSEEMRDALRAFASEMGPALAETMSMIDEIGNYEKPEILPNGDIIIRRSPEAPPWEPPMSDEDAEVEL
ncbi:hypothetical protein [Pelagovum pacificum]|uniref:AAA+ family ATPase n=1 Tax=Pelagovum pacificum TaxID=2588711 RepID=A0A5C5GAR0_9RHOB|nr:hypothetical protein [Pelagovum pacificum]QQA41312.1 hypothetical protein I8N54_10760 [Pelagovum pacificum]TNY31882.1 hypothetical protein FHY64_00835 [Pelagovum pacificum]